MQAQLIDMILDHMAKLIREHADLLLHANRADVARFDDGDLALYDRLIIDEAKVESMAKSVEQIRSERSPLNQIRYSFQHDNGMRVENRTVPFGTIMIIYESRPDVTVEAVAVALKSGNRIILKGGKEAKESNLALVRLWQLALEAVGADRETVRYLAMDRTSFQEYLKQPDAPIDLIIPRGGEKLISFVQSVAPCPVLVSGRGNNFLYVSQHADLEMAMDVILNAKLSKVSACNALDKVLTDSRVPDAFMDGLKSRLREEHVELVEPDSEAVWKEEFLARQIVVHTVKDLGEAVSLINRYSGGHSASIISTDTDEAERFMHEVDCGAVYHNASTRFTDGGQFGMGAEMAISTDKLHHRGPLGLNELVTNKWFVYGAGQTR